MQQITSRLLVHACCALLVACVLPASAVAQDAPTNQRLFDTGPFLPEHYENRLERFEAEPAVPGGILFLGDSITEGGDWVDLTGDSSALNRGISGDVTFGVLERLDEVVRWQPSRLFLLIGVNDIGKDIPEAVVADNVRKIVEGLQEGSPATRIFVQSLLPVDPAYPGFPQHYDKEHRVIRLNRLLREAAATADVTFINLYPIFLDDLGRLDDRFTTDGLHLNRAGYELWAEYLKQNGFP